MDKHADNKSEDKLFIKNIRNYGIVSVKEYYWTSIKDCGDHSVEKMMNNLPEFKRLENTTVVTYPHGDEVKNLYVNFTFI
jgi:hypothetical protein